jgi:hypothetical protein
LSDKSNKSKQDSLTVTIISNPTFANGKSSNITPDPPHACAAAASQVCDGAFRPKAPTRAKAVAGGTL